MRRPWLTTLSLAVALLVALVSCRQVPMSGRKQLVLIPQSEEMAIGRAAYAELLSKERLSDNAQHVGLVQRVGRRIAAVTGRNDYDWEFNLIASRVQNAFCLPGGKVAVYEGILPVCQNEAGLAVVMSHEIAHAVARHGAERMSQGLIVEGVGMALSYATRSSTAFKRKMILKAYGVGAQLGFVLPYSRGHELEADSLGLMYMARAGYDPSEAPRFWARFAQQQAGNARLPELLSTHPADAHRVEALKRLLPQAMALYARAPRKYGLGEPIEVELEQHAGLNGRQQTKKPPRAQSVHVPAVRAIPW